MSLGRCIPDMVKRGEIDAARGKRMQEVFDELDAFYRRTMGPEAAAAEASEATLKQLRREAKLKKRQELLQASRQRAAVKDLDRHQDGVSYAAIRAMLDDDALGAPYGNVTRGAQRIEFQAQGRMRAFIERHRRNLIGKPQDQSGLMDVVREMHGQGTGNDRAKLFADTIADTFEQLRQRFNAAGGNIGRLEHWFPHSWSALKVRAASADDWLAAMTPAIDRARMIDDATGKPMSDERLREALLSVRETIRTNGMTGEPSAAFRGGGKLANTRSDHRFLHFRDADAWAEVNDRFGSGDNPFATIMGHVNGMASDIAQMERFGPNPDATMRYLLDTVEKRNAQADTAYSAEAAGRSGGRVLTEQLWRYVKGESRTPVVPDSLLQGPPVWFSSGFDAVRNVMTSAMLGSSPLSAISDINTQLLARGFNGLPQARAIRSYLEQLSVFSGDKRRLAIQLGLGMRDASHSMLAIHRYLATATGPHWSQVAADSVLRASGLNKFTEAGQRAFGLDLLGSLGEMRGTKYHALPERIRGMFDRYGVDANAWEAIRTAPPVMHEGLAYIDPSAIGTGIGGQQASDRLMDMVLAETDRAVQDGSASVRAAFTANQRPGTWGHWLMANTFQFKAFGIGLLADQARRIGSLGPYRGAVYGAQFFIGMTLFGALAIQLREIAKGRDPRPMDDAEFWADAALQGGGIGIFGDVIGSFSNDRIGGWGELVAGPVGSFLTDVGKAGHSALPGRERADGTRREANPGGAAVRLARRYTPGGNIWYLRAAWERMVIDTLQSQVDPTAELARGREAKRLAKNRQGAWWKAGDPLPERAPDYITAVGGAP